MTTASPRPSLDATAATSPPLPEIKPLLLRPPPARGASGRAPWPYADPDAAPLPATMPGGEPWPRISVVTPSFNQGHYIEETILSVLNQGYPNLEYIVIDGGSTDRTLAVLERYESRLACCVSEPDGGQSDAINKGFARATGEIFTWLNSDDMLAPGALAAAAIAFRTSGADLIAGICEVYRDGALWHRHLTGCDDGPLPLDDLLDLENGWLAGQFFYQPEVMFTRALWEKAGGFVDRRWHYSMDYDLWIRFAEVGARLHVVGRPLARFRAHREQKTAATADGGFRGELPRVRDAALARLGRATPAERRPPAGARQRLRIVLFNDLGFAFGAGIAHRRVARALQLGGHDVRAVSATSKDTSHKYVPLAPSEVVAAIRAHKPDLVVVGNLHGVTLDPSVLGAIADAFPTVYLLHDLWLLTGRCAYPGPCRRYLKGCRASCSCPPGHPDGAPSQVEPAWEAKRRVLDAGGASGQLALWANSRWALERVDEALAHTRPGATARALERAVVKFGYELDAFRPRDRAFCREQLGLPADRFILMCSASSVADPRKGLAHLAKALRLAGLHDVLVTAVGRLHAGHECPIPDMRLMGYFAEPERLAMLYAAADLFVGPSLEEAFGQVFVEAAACGTPSVGYPVGGVPEAIVDGLSGRIAREVSPAALAEAIAELYENPDLRRDMGRWGRLWVENEWSMASSCHRFHVSMRRGRLGERLGLARKVHLAGDAPPPREPETISVLAPSWAALNGLGAWEKPNPRVGLGRCRWMLGPVSRIEVRAGRPGPHWLALRVRNFHRGQMLRVVCGGKTLFEGPVPVTGHQRDEALRFLVDVRGRAAVVEFYHWKWAAGRPLALLMTECHVARAE